MITTNNVYNCFNFEKLKEENIYMSPELFMCYFIGKNKDVNLINEKKSNTFSIALLVS